MMDFEEQYVIQFKLMDFWEQMHLNQSGIFESIWFHFI